MLDVNKYVIFASSVKLACQNYSLFNIQSLWIIQYIYIYFVNQVWLTLAIISCGSMTDFDAVTEYSSLITCITFFFQSWIYFTSHAYTSLISKKNHYHLKIMYFFKKKNFQVVNHAIFHFFPLSALHDLTLKERYAEDTLGFGSQSQYRSLVTKSLPF